MFSVDIQGIYCCNNNNTVGIHWIENYKAETIPAIFSLSWREKSLQGSLLGVSYSKTEKFEVFFNKYTFINLTKHKYILDNNFILFFSLA